MLVYSLLASYCVCDEMLAVILTLIPLYIMCLFFLSATFKSFSLSFFGFQQFCYVPRCGSLYIYPTQGLSSFTDWQTCVFHQVWGIYIFFTNTCLFSLFSFWDSSYIYIRPFDFVLQSSRLCLFLFHFFLFFRLHSLYRSDFNLLLNPLSEFFNSIIFSCKICICLFCPQLSAEFSICHSLRIYFLLIL